MPPLPASKGNTEDEVKRSEEFLNQLSLGSTATGTPLTRDTARFEASRSRSGSASRHPEAEVPGDGCHLLEEEEEVEPEVADPQKCREDVQIKQPPGPSPKQEFMEFRRRTYTAPGSEMTQVGRVSRPSVDLCDSDDAKHEEVVISGPLQQRFWGFWWRWRWCVLKGSTMYIYRDEAQWQAEPGAFFESHDVGEMFAVNENHHNGVAYLRCIHSETSSNLATFRGGENEIWEEVAATHLWVDLLSSARRELMDDSPNAGLASTA
mmetsp:Transcript_50041/g.119544  ORF Transcript_50041/g.119544 Transcript_50041/m.119544 type:complete len:264 (+) Transcript_50041:123-914(+)